MKPTPQPHQRHHAHGSVPLDPATCLALKPIHDIGNQALNRSVPAWWIKVPWQNYGEMGECPQCVRCGVSMQLNSPDSEWGEDEESIFNVCNSCAASLLPEMWQRLND